MAPDLNSFSTSPRQDRAHLSQPSSTAASRRTSQIMAPPAAPMASPGSSAPYHPMSPQMNNEQSGVPMRHPRPLTAAELHLELEQEQEAVVNRLTRELSALRAQHSASVASNASHSSAASTPSLLPVDISDPNPTHQITGSTHPHPSRRRGSSSVSTRSNTTPSTSASSILSGTHAMPHAGFSQASADRAAAAGGLSRQPSISASGRSTPARPSLEHTSTSTSTANLYAPRPSVSQAVSFTSQTTSASTAATAGSVHMPSPGSPVVAATSLGTAMQHYADTAAYRAELDAVKAENEALRQHIRALERQVRQTRRQSSASEVSASQNANGGGASGSAVASTAAAAGFGVGGRERSETRPGVSVSAWSSGSAPPRERSESQSTTASSRRGGGGAGEEREEVVRVGESAGSAGLGISGR